MSEPVLSQQQVDQLIEAIVSGKVSTSPDSLVEMRRAIPLDLTNPSWSQDRIIRRRLPVLDLVFDRLGPSMQVTLTKSLRSPVRTEDISVELQKFGDFRKGLEGKRRLFEIMRIDPLRGSCILVMAPKAGLRALVTAEREGVLWSNVVTLDSAATAVEIPIAEEWRPNIYVSVVIVEGAGPQDSPDKGRPKVYVGMVELDVDAEDEHRTVTVLPEREQYRPREKVEVTVKVERLEDRHRRGPPQGRA